MATSPEELLAAVVAHNLAVAPVAVLAERWGWSIEDLDQAAAELVERGLVERWEEAPDGPALVLSFATVDRLGLILDDSDRWVSRDAKPKPIVAGRSSKHAIRECDLSDAETSLLESMPDRSTMDPAKVAGWHEGNERAIRAAEEAEATMHRSSAARADLTARARSSAPLLLLGLGATWPVPFEPGSRCRCCEDATGQWVCLVCCSSSMDDRIGKPPSEATLAKQAARFEVAGRKLAGGLGKAG